MIKTWALKIRDYSVWDRLGMGLSLVCALHCLLTPLSLLFLPILARYYLMHPGWHLVLALIILPVGLIAFISGYRHHRNLKIFWFGLPGLVLVSFVPYLVHSLGFMINEPFWMILGSALLIVGHWINRKSCQTCHSTN